jgi:hypothetical protein
MRLILGTVFAATSLLAAGGINAGISGNYVEARTADVYTGPCFANSEAGLTGQLAVMGWTVKDGSWDGVDLKGLSVVGVVRASSTLGDVHFPDYKVKSILIVDENANPEQRMALQSFAKHMGGDLLNDVVKVDSSAISLNFARNDIHSMEASLKAGNLAEIRTRAMAEADQICHNEITWYPPLTSLSHSMPAYTLENGFHGKGLGTVWSSPDKRSSFLGTFNVEPTVTTESLQ